MTNFRCPERDIHPHFRITRDDQEPTDTLRADGTCSFCNSLNSDTLLRLMADGKVEITPTDKDYKIYVTGLDGSIGHVNFYFWHLPEDRRQEFIDLCNEQKVPFAYPGYFYVLPYFCKIA